MSIIPLQGLGFDESLSYEEVAVEILDRKFKKSINKNVASIEVVLRNNQVEGATWEGKEDMKSQYLIFFPLLLFKLEVCSSSIISLFWKSYVNFVLSMVS